MFENMLLPAVCSRMFENIADRRSIRFIFASLVANNLLVAVIIENFEVASCVRVPAPAISTAKPSLNCLAVGSDVTPRRS